MTELFATVASNVAVASVLALFACTAGRWLRRPALTHGLWVLVLVKLITPPLAPLPMDWLLPAAVHEIEPRHGVLAEGNVAKPLKALPVPAANAVEHGPEPEDQERPAPAAIAPENEVAGPVDPAPLAPPAQELPAADLVPAEVVMLPPAGAVPPPAASPINWTLLAAGLWFTGSLVWFLLAGWRVHRFGRVLDLAQPAPPALQTLARDLAQRLGVRCPQVLVTSAPLSPLLWVFGREPRLLLPAGLLARMDEAQQAALIAHELAHWRRRDHLVRWLEIVVLGLYWWCPLAWWARTELQQAEEECCDAWVVWALPGAAKSYALALVETIDFLSGAVPVLPPAASGIGHVRFLKRRLTMILRGQTPRALTAAGILGLVGLAALLLPLAPGWGQAPPTPTQRNQQNDNQNRNDNQNNRNNNEEQGDRDGNQADKVRQEVQRIQADVEKLRAELEKRQQQLHKIQAQNRPFDDKAKDQRKDMQPPPIAPGGNKPGPQRQPNISGHQQGGDRLHEVERKLDLLLWEIQAMRRDMQGNRPQGPGHGPGGGPMNPGGFQPQPGGNPGRGNPGGGPGGPGSQPPGGVQPPRQNPPQGQPPLGPGLIPAPPVAVPPAGAPNLTPPPPPVPGADVPPRLEN